MLIAILTSFDGYFLCILMKEFIILSILLENHLIILLILPISVLTQMFFKVRMISKFTWTLNFQKYLFLYLFLLLLLNFHFKDYISINFTKILIKSFLINLLLVIHHKLLRLFDFILPTFHQFQLIVT